MNPLRDFVKYACIREEDAETTTERLYMRFREYKEETEMKEVGSKQSFVEYFKQFDFKPVKIGGMRGWQGIRLRQSDQDFGGSEYATLAQ